MDPTPYRSRILRGSPSASRRRGGRGRRRCSDRRAVRIDMPDHRRAPAMGEGRAGYYGHFQRGQAGEDRGEAPTSTQAWMNAHHWSFMGVWAHRGRVTCHRRTRDASAVRKIMPADVRPASRPTHIGWQTLLRALRTAPTPPIPAPGGQRERRDDREKSAGVQQRPRRLQPPDETIAAFRHEQQAPATLTPKAAISVSTTLPDADLLDRHGASTTLPATVGEILTAPDNLA